MWQIHPGSRCATATGVALPMTETDQSCGLLAGRSAAGYMQGWAAASKLKTCVHFKSPVWHILAQIAGTLWMNKGGTLGEHCRYIMGENTWHNLGEQTRYILARIMTRGGGTSEGLSRAAVSARSA